MEVLLPGLVVPANPAIPAGLIKGRRTKTDGSDNLRTGQKQIAQLGSHQGGALERMLAADEPVPDQVLGVLGIHNEAPMQIGNFLDGRGQPGQRRQRLPVVEKPALGGSLSPGRRRWQAYQALLLQSFHANVGRTQT